MRRKKGPGGRSSCWNGEPSGDFYIPPIAKARWMGHPGFGGWGDSTVAHCANAHLRREETAPKMGHPVLGFGEEGGRSLPRTILPPPPR